MEHKKWSATVEFAAPVLQCNTQHLSAVISMFETIY